VASITAAWQGMLRPRSFSMNSNDSRSHTLPHTPQDSLNRNMSHSGSRSISGMVRKNSSTSLLQRKDPHTLMSRGMSMVMQVEDKIKVVYVEGRSGAGKASLMRWFGEQVKAAAGVTNAVVVLAVSPSLCYAYYTPLSLCCTRVLNPLISIQ
jgi:hypothetical protein